MYYVGVNEASPPTLSPTGEGLGGEAIVYNYIYFI